MSSKLPPSLSLKDTFLGSLIFDASQVGMEWSRQGAVGWEPVRNRQTWKDVPEDSSPRTRDEGKLIRVFVAPWHQGTKQGKKVWVGWSAVDLSVDLSVGTPRSESKETLGHLPGFVQIIQSCLFISYVLVFLMPGTDDSGIKEKLMKIWGAWSNVSSAWCLSLL